MQPLIHYAERYYNMAELNMELFNNQFVQKLVGVSDANLRLIEKMLNVEILCFGNQIVNFAKFLNVVFLFFLPPGLA